MKRKIAFYCFSLCLCFSLSSVAQDKMLTQAFAHPVDLNPAFAGDVDGRYRVSIAYRDQWQSIIESPFVTMGVYGDFKIEIDNRNDDYFGAGFSLITDRTPVLNVNQNMLSLYGSYHKALNADIGQYLSAGLNLGIAQRSINYENIYFNDQFNGLDEYSLSTAENLPANNFAFIDLGLGLRYTSKTSRYSSFTTGFSVDHIQGGSISFYHIPPESDENLPDAKLERKFTGYLSMELASNEIVAFLPRIIWQLQGEHQMLSAAGLVKLDLNNYDNQALHLGGGIRLNQTPTTALKASTAYLLMAYEVSGLLIGLSHDILLNGLNESDKGKGAFELSISYTGFYQNEETLCPSF